MSEVADRLEGRFDLTRRGLIHVKGKGEMETFLLNAEIDGARAQVRVPESSSSAAS